MSKEDKALELVSETLLTNKKYPWKTAIYLSSRLHDDKDFDITSEALDEILIAHTRSHGRRIRHSFYPSRATLDLLWGHVDNVKDFDSLFDPALEKQAGDFRPCEVPTDAPWLFLSHKSQDIQAVLSIRDDLVTRGYGVWLAEAEIFDGEIITKRVQEGLKQCDQFIVYMTRAALGSRWILKEVGVAIHKWHRPSSVLVYVDDPDLITLFKDWLNDAWDKSLHDRINGMLDDATPEPAPTPLSDLLVAALNDVPSQDRRAVLYPDQCKSAALPFSAMDNVFPRRIRPDSEMPFMHDPL